MKKTISLLLVLVMMMSFMSLGVSASSEDDWAIPEPTESTKDNPDLTTWYPLLDWTATSSIVHGISVNGRTGEVTVSYTASGGDYTVKVFYRLQKQTSLGSWSTTYTSPTTTGTFSAFINRSHTLSNGYYRVQTVGKVYDRNGNYLETVTENSRSYVCV